MFSSAIRFEISDQISPPSSRTVQMPTLSLLFILTDKPLNHRRVRSISANVRLEFSDDVERSGTCLFDYDSTSICASQLVETIPEGSSSSAAGSTCRTDRRSGVAEIERV